MGAWNTVRNYIERTLEMINFNDINIEYVGISIFNDCDWKC